MGVASRFAKSRSAKSPFFFAATSAAIAAKFSPDAVPRRRRISTTAGSFIGLSVDNLDDHEKWSADIEETQGVGVNFPILADKDRKVSQLYDMIHPNVNETFTVRSVFVIDPNKKIRLIITYPMTAGRNFDEILRTVDSMQLTDQFKVATPVNWKRGEDVIIVPAVTNEEADSLFPKGYKVIKPYLRTTPQPNA